MLDASLETKDKGRGMNSMVSEKPTRFLLVVRDGGESELPVVSLLSQENDVRLDLSPVPSGLGNIITWFSFAEGVVGALPPNVGVIDEGGLMIMDKSWHDIAADLR